MPPAAMIPGVDTAEDRGDAGEVRGRDDGQAEDRGEASPR